MNRTKFIEHIEEVYKRGVDLIKTKNQDYGADSNPFKNFEHTVIAGVSPERAIVVRMADKLSRISTCLDKDVQVMDEKVDDTVLDLINYAAILHARLTANKENKDA